MHWINTPFVWNTTAFWIIGLLAFIIGLDIFFVFRWGYHGTISYDTKVANRDTFRIIGVLLGVLLSHLCISRSDGIHDLLMDAGAVFIGLAIGLVVWSQ